MSHIKTVQKRLHWFTFDPAARVYFREQLELITYNSNISNAYEDDLEQGLERDWKEGLDQGQTLPLKA